VSIDTDAHAPGQLEWQPYGCDKAARMGIDPSEIVNTWAADDLVAWAGAHPTN
jgi:putative hydrolase